MHTSLKEACWSTMVQVPSPERGKDSRLSPPLDEVVWVLSTTAEVLEAWLVGDYPSFERLGKACLGR